MRLGVQQWLMGMAAITAQRSTCCRRAVGCVLVDHHNHVLSTGYNGVAAGLPHCNTKVERPEFGGVERYEPPFMYPNACAGAFAPSGTQLDACQAIHAEQNALLQCRGVREIYACYVTTSPCVTCTKLLLNTGCQEIYFLESYPQPQARELWIKAGRKIWAQLDQTSVNSYLQRTFPGI